MIERRCLPSLEDQIEAYLYLERHPSENLLYSLKELNLLEPSTINTYLNYLETGKEQLFLDNIKENLCYLIAKDLFPEEPVKRTVEFYNNYQRIGEAVLSYYKSLNKRIKKPESINSKTTLLSKLGINFPLLTAEQRRAIESVLADTSIEERFHGYKPEDIKFDGLQVRFNKKNNEIHLFKAIKYYKECKFEKSNEEYKKLLEIEPKLTFLINKFMHFNNHLVKKADEVLKKYDEELKRIVGQKKSLVGIAHDLREKKYYEFLEESFRFQNKLIEIKNSYLLKTLERAVIDSKYAEDFFFIDSIHFELATNYQSLGDDRKSLGWLKMIASEDLLPYAHWMIALAYEDLGKHKEAVKYWKKLVRTKDFSKDFEITYNRTNEVGHIKSPLLKKLIFKQNTQKERPKREFENTSFIFNKIKDCIFNTPVPILYVENPKGKSYALFKEVKPSVGKALTLLEELEYCKKILAKIGERVKKEHPWFDEQAIFKEYKHLMIRNVVDQLADMQTGISPGRIKKHAPEIKDYNYEKTLEEKLARRVNKPEILEHSKPITSYLEKKKKVFGHCDLNGTNILDLGYGELCFIDFEHSALTNQLFDLAYFLERPYFDLGKEDKKEMIEYFISKLKEKGEKVENPYKYYLYNAAFVNMRIIAGYSSWAKKTGKKYYKEINFHKKSAIKDIDKIIEKDEKSSENLLKLKKSLRELKIR